MTASEGSENCPDCDRSFGSIHGLVAHHSQKHEGEFRRVDVECAACGDTISRRQSEADNTERNFCSAECQSDWLADNNTGEDHPLYEGGEGRQECDNCGSVFRKHDSKLRGDHVFCSVTCKAEWQSQHHTGKNNPAYNSTEVNCDQCGESIQRPAHVESSQSHHFCSTSCYGSWRSKNIVEESHHAWEGGQPEYGNGWNTPKRRQVRVRDQARCQDCGMTESEHMDIYERKLNIHHITPARQFDDPQKRNAVSNLITLCIPCHATWEQMAPLRPDTRSTTD